MRVSRSVVFIFLLIIILSIIPNINAQETPKDEQVIIHYPAENETIKETTPSITGDWNIDGQVDITTVKIEVNGFDVTDWEESTIITQTNFTYHVVSFFDLQNGNHTVNVTFQDKDGNHYEYSWKFVVDTSLSTEDEFQITMMDVIIGMGVVITFVIVSFLGFIIYLKVAKGFNVRKFLKRHPPDKVIFIVYVPLVISILILVLGLLYINENQVPTPYAIEYLLITCLIMAGAPFAWAAGRDRKQVETYEHAFSQLLFELADAMRGGINPAKAIIEIAETDTSIFRKHLKIASKNIMTGRPFEEVLVNLAKPTRSEVIRRYTTLIGEASKVGGQISIVVHRAAKDMDDLIKVKQERQRQLQIQMLTVYIAFVVLVIVAYMLIDIYPEIANVNLGVIMNFNLEAASSATDTSSSGGMSYDTVKRRFFHLVVLNSIGSGLVIGKLLFGKLKYGLIHCLIMVGVGTLVFAIGIF